MTTSGSAIRFLNPPALSQPFGYTHVVETHGGRTVYISGQVAFDTAGNVVGVDDLREQTTQVFKNLEAAPSSRPQVWPSRFGGWFAMSC